MHVEDHLSLDKLKRLVRGQQDVKLSKRMQMVVLASEGYTAPAIARSLSSSRRVCQHWVQQYNAAGLEGLQDRDSPRTRIRFSRALCPDTPADFWQRIADKENRHCW